MRNLPRFLLSSLLAALFALAWSPVASGDDKKTGGDEKKKPSKEEERRAAEKAAEEKKRRDEENRKKANEENWDDRTRPGSYPWPEPPDTGEMMDAAKGHKGGECEGEPKPGVGGYRKPAGDGDAEAAEAAGGGFGEGGKDHAAAPPKDEKKDEKKEDKKDDREHKEEHK